jgi:hypothetical protein
MSDRNYRMFIAALWRLVMTPMWILALSNYRRNLRRLSAALSVLLVGFLLLEPQARAQVATADLTGTVTDVSGGIVQNAKVTLENVGTHEDRVAQTNGAGNYTFTFLQAGEYAVKVEANGFKTLNIASVRLQAGDHGRGDAKLQIGQDSVTVEVTSANPLLQTEDATVSSTITTQAVENLPTSGRNLTSLVFLTPGVNEAASVDGLNSGQRPDDRRQTSSFTINGADPEINNNQLDGQDNNERVIGTIGVKPSLDMIEQVTVLTNDFTPEIGRSAGGVISVITKSGTNQFHGSAYEFVENDKFNGNNPFNNAATNGGMSLPTAELRQNDFGGSVGGPIRRDKTFFFAGYEGLRLINAANASYAWVPSQAEYTAIQSGNVQGLINADPATAGMAASPIAVNLAKIYPAPTNPCLNPSNCPSVPGNFVYIPKHTMYSTTVDGRVDHTFTPSNLVFARYTSNDVSSYIPTGMPNATVNGVSINPGNGQYGFAGPALNQAYNSEVSYIHIFSSNLGVENRVGYTRVYNHSSAPNTGTGAGVTVGFPGASFNIATGSGLPLTNVGGGFAPLGDSNFVPITDISNTFEYDGSVNYTIGRHTIKMGGVVIYRQAQNNQSSNGIGSLAFGGLVPAGTGPSDDGGPNDYTAGLNANDLAEFLVGAFNTQVSRNVDLYTPNYRSWEPGIYAQDAWKVSSKLTLTYGMRYDIYTPFTEAHGYLSNYDPVNRVLLVPQKGLNFLKAQGADTTGIVGAGKTAGIRTDFENFEPRVGFAYTVLPETVVRGGLGVAFYPGNYTSNASMKNAPFNAIYSPNINGNGCESLAANQIQKNVGFTTGNGLTPACTLPGQVDVLSQGIPIPPPQSLVSPNLSLGDNVDLNYRNSSVYQMNLLVERQLGKNVITIGYAGQLGRHLPVVLNNINQYNPTGTAPTALTPTGSPTGFTQITSPSCEAEIGAGTCFNVWNNQLRPTVTIGPNGQMALPNLGGVGEYKSIGSGHYHSLQATFARRYANGLTVNANYTWSHVIDDATTLSYEGQEGFGNADPFDIGDFEKGNGDMDLRHRLLLSGTYELPFFKASNGVEKLVLGGWQTNGIYIYNSGSPFSITDNYSYPGNSVYAAGGGPTRPLEIANPALPHRAKAGVKSVWFNGNAFETPGWGVFGNSPRNGMYGPHFQHLDFSIFKEFAVSERAKVQFRVESFNLANHPNFFVENDQNDQATTNGVGVFAAALLGDGGFSQIAGMSPNYTPRELQFALKFLF